MFKPRDYQIENVQSIIDKFHHSDRLLYQLSTGGGKTYITTILSKSVTNEKYPNLFKGKKVLFLCHRDKLLRQTIKSMNNVGLTCESITRKVKKLNHHADIYVGMIETVSNRLKKNPYFFKNVGLVVCDECHILIFNKIFDYFKGVKILGCTATPVVLKRETFYRCHRCMSDYDYEGECCGIETDEYSKPFAMSQIYDDIVIGPSIDWLIEQGYLVREISFVENYTDNSNLKTDKDGEFTTKSIDETYGSGSAVFNVILNYEKLCAGKKTMIFNSSTKVNKKIYEKFLESGYENVRMYDSVNKEESGDQDEVITWFENTPGSVLLNCGVFTTGTDVVDIEAIILNRPTNSLSLYLQMVGRGGRITDKIFKDSFIVIDGGGNIDRHLEWSDPTRDWERIFWDGMGEERQKVTNVMDVQDCEECGALFPKGLKECPECGHEMERKKEKAPKVLSDEVLEPIRKIPPPNAEKIYQYTIKREENINFSFKILIGKIVDMFIFYRVTKESYLSAQQSGELRKKVDNMLYKNYFVLIRKQDIKSGSNRTLEYLRNKVYEKLEKYYL